MTNISGGVPNNANNIRNSPPLNIAKAPATPEVKQASKKEASKIDVAPTKTSENNTRKVEQSTGNPVEVSFKTLDSAADAKKTDSVPSVRRLGKTEPAESLLNFPDLPGSDDLQEAVDYYQSAVSAIKEGAVDMAQDFLAWAKELDPGAPDLPKF